jgi:hypothetical protein
MRSTVLLFVYLQILDILSTLIGFSLGNGEASPFIRLLILWGPVTGLLVSKLLAVGLVALCIAVKRAALVGWINYWYGAVVLWNLLAAMRVLNS